jgi:hypothetical protein
MKQALEFGTCRRTPPPVSLAHLFWRLSHTATEPPKGGAVAVALRGAQAERQAVQVAVFLEVACTDSFRLL